MKKNYLKEMAESGYNQKQISSFHQICLPYLGNKFFPEKQSKILDIGVAQGHCLFPLKKNGWLNLWAADIDVFNKDLFERNEIKFSPIDLERDKFSFEDDFFDVILSFHLIEHLHNAANFLNEVYRILKKNGVFVLVTPDWRKQYKVFWHDHTHIHPYDKTSISRIMKCFNFQPVWIKSFGVIRGIGRTNLWKLVEPLMFTGRDIICVSQKKLMIN